MSCPRCCSTRSVALRKPMMAPLRSAHWSAARCAASRRRPCATRVLLAPMMTPASGSTVESAEAQLIPTMMQSAAHCWPALTVPGSASAGQTGSAETVALNATSGIPGKVLVGSGGRTYSRPTRVARPPARERAPRRGRRKPSPARPYGQRYQAGAAGHDQTARRTTLVTYNGHPLYYFAGDAEPGEDHGQGSKALGAGWYVVNAGGSMVDADWP